MSEKPVPAWVNFLSGTLGGMTATACIKPLDTVITRSASNKNKDETTSQMIMRMIRQEGITSLYRGLPVSLLSSGLSWGLFYMFADPIKAAINRVAPNTSPAVKTFLSSYASGLLTTTLMNPLYAINTKIEASGKKLSVIGALNSVFREQGLRAFSRGFESNILTTAISATQSVVQNKVLAALKSKKTLTASDYFAVYAGGKMLASAFSHPLNVVQIRKRLAATYDTSFPLVSLWRMIRTSGVGSMYPGYGTALTRVVPNYAVTVTSALFYKNFLLGLSA